MNTINSDGFLLALDKEITAVAENFITDEFEGSLYVDMDLKQNIKAYQSLSFGF